MRVAFTMLLLLAGLIGLCFAGPWLWQQHSAQPPLTSLPEWMAAGAFTSLGLAVAIMLHLLLFPRQQMQLAPVDGSDEFHLLPRQLRNEHVRNRTAILAIGAVPAAAFALYAEATLRSVPTGAHLLAATAAILCLALILHLVQNKFRTPHHTEPRLTLTSAQPRIDEPFHLRLRMEALASVQLPECRARFICFEHKLLHTGRYVQLSIYPHSEKAVVLSEPIELAAHQTLSASAEVLLESPTHLPTGQPGITMYPFYHWEIHLAPAGHPQATTIFPLTVAPPSRPNLVEEMTPSFSDAT